MPQWKEQDVTDFQKLYLKHYGKKINQTEADIKITALVELLALTIEEMNMNKSRDSRKNTPYENLSEPD